MIGKEVGPYLIVEEIGDGGHAFVFRGIRRGGTKGDESVAIKMLKPSATADPATEKRFLLEVDALKQLDHPNIVGFKDYIVLNGYHYLVIEFVDAGSTEQVLRFAGPIEPRYLIPILNQVLLGVAHAHSLGYVHRDLKPSNILLNQEGQAKITDFGIAKMLGGEALTKQGFVLGTTPYMAPEYLTHGRDNEQLDIYALGVTSYELLTGRKPFEFERDDETVAAFAARVMKEAPPSLASHREISAELDRIIMKAIEQDPRKRYKTADRFRQDLAAAFPDFVNRPIQILHGRPRTDVVQMQRKQDDVSHGAPSTTATGLLFKLSSMFGSKGGRKRAVNGSRDQTPPHARRVPYMDELNAPARVETTDASELSAFLVVTSGTDGETRFGLRPISRVGRDERFDIRVHDSEVSRQHALITFDGKGFSIRDLNSANGTFVNEKRIELERDLVDGDLIRIGQTTLRFDYQPRR